MDHLEAIGVAVCRVGLFPPFLEGQTISVEAVDAVEDQTVFCSELDLWRGVGSWLVRHVVFQWLVRSLSGS